MRVENSRKWGKVTEYDQVVFRTRYVQSIYYLALTFFLFQGDEIFFLLVVSGTFLIIKIYLTRQIIILMCCSHKRDCNLRRKRYLKI